MAKSKSPSETKPCPVCDGRGVSSFGTVDIKCSRCKGKGTVKA